MQEYVIVFVDVCVCLFVTAERISMKFGMDTSTPLTLWIKA